MRRSAFTLMELLIVIAIIMILMGLVFVGVRMAREAAMRSKTNTILQQVSAGLEQYRLVVGRFPDGGNFDAMFAGNPAYTGITRWSDIANELATNLNNNGGTFKVPLVDAWGAQYPLHYRPARYLPYLSTGATAEIDNDDPPGRDSYQLWSTGPNHQDEGGTAISDDITSWPKK